MDERTSERQARFQALLAEHRGIALKAAYTYCRRQADRDDLVQEICAELWRSFPRYDDSRPFSTWMYRVALNVAISEARRASARRLRTVSLDGEEVREVAAPAAAEPDERIEELDRVIARLGPLDRALALLYLGSGATRRSPTSSASPRPTSRRRSTGSSNAFAESWSSRIPARGGESWSSTI
jgi:RNA polymerase sigma-70 factor (ECF subfamily)